jgi:RES domain-containing protein
MHDFFVAGSYVAETIAPVYQMNSLNTKPALFDPTLEADATLASELTGQVIFHYGPPLWRFGETEHKHAFDAGGPERTEAARAFVAAVPRLILPSGTRLFRLRRNVDADETIVLAGSFDPPPPDPGRTPGRFDYGGVPVLYAADDIELCLHECRVTLADEIVVATLINTEPLELLDLSVSIETGGGTPFEDPNIFAAFLSRSRQEQWLGYARTVAETARAAGLAGIRYPSYYAQAKQDCEALNVALFGRPITDGVLTIQSVNRLRLTDARYAYSFGPVLYSDRAMRAEIAAFMVEADRAKNMLNSLEQPRSRLRRWLENTWHNFVMSKRRRGHEDSADDPSH